LSYIIANCPKTKLEASVKQIVKSIFIFKVCAKLQATFISSY
jgi:hypothetical protein